MKKEKRRMSTLTPHVLGIPRFLAKILDIRCGLLRVHTSLSLTDIDQNLIHISSHVLGITL